MIQRARGCGIGNSGAYLLATSGSLNSETAHQAFDRAARDGLLLAVQLTPYLISAVDLHVLLPNPVNLRHQGCIAFDAYAQQCWIPLLGDISPIA
jgi:hypothetical protein